VGDKKHFEPMARQFNDRIFRAEGGGIVPECACCIVCCSTNSAEISTTDYFGFKNSRLILRRKFFNA
jgi:hypothetical protein